MPLTSARIADTMRRVAVRRAGNPTTTYGGFAFGSYLLVVLGDTVSAIAYMIC